MPYFKTSTEWFEQSSLLLKARPTTVRLVLSHLPLPSFEKKKQVTNTRNENSVHRPA